MKPARPRRLLPPAPLLVSLGLLIALREAPPRSPAAGHPQAGSAPTTGGPVAAPVEVSPVADERNWIRRENQRKGTGAWRIDDLVATEGIEGFADRVNAVEGDRVTLFVSTRAPTYHVDAYRMGFYGGDGARLVWQSEELPGRTQPPPLRDAETRMVEARWEPSVRLDIDIDWIPGAYLLKLVGSNGPARYVPLTIRDDDAGAGSSCRTA